MGREPPAGLTGREMRAMVCECAESGRGGDVGGEGVWVWVWCERGRSRKVRTLCWTGWNVRCVGGGGVIEAMGAAMMCEMSR